MVVKAGTIPRARGRLEDLVIEVGNLISAGSLEEPEGRPWTPHRLAKEVTTRYPGSGAPPSTGAISDTLRRWREIGFAEIGADPLSFIDFTAEGRTVGLAALKAKARANKVAKHKKEAGENPQLDTGLVTFAEGAESAAPSEGPTSESEAHAHSE